MNSLKPFPVILACLLLLLPFSWCGAQEKVIKGKVSDSQNYQYSLTGLSVSGVTVFHLKILDTEFRLQLEKIRSLAVVLEPVTEPPNKGYVLADVTLNDGSVSRAWIDFENYWIEGVDEKLGEKLKIKLTDVVRLDLITEILPPAPAPASSTPL
jgi:hypothetical protein